MGTIYCRIIFQLTPRPLADVPPLFLKERGKAPNTRGEGVSWAKKHKFKYDIISFLLFNTSPL
jgi:hypothetical protein